MTPTAPSGLPQPGAIAASSISRARSRSRPVYLECIPLFARGLVGLPDHPKLLRELRLLERHTHRSGKDAVDHPRNGHDDHANVVCGVLHLLSKQVVDYNEIPWVTPFYSGKRRYIPGQTCGETMSVTINLRD